MAERSLVVRLVGDERDLLRAYSRSERATKDFGRTTDTTLGKADKRFKSLRSAGAGFAGGFVASEVLGGLRTFVDKAAESQRVLTQVQQGLKNTGQSWDEYADQIDRAVTAQSKLGFDDEDLLESFDRFNRSVGDVNKALKLNELAMDVARGRNIDLAAASTLVVKAASGQRGALTRLGIQVNKNADATELLRVLTEKYGNSAEAAANDASTAQARLNVQLENAQEQIGTFLLPVVSKLADNLAEANEKGQLVVGTLQKIAKAKIPVLNIPLNFTIGGQSIGDRIKDQFGTNLLPPQLRNALPFIDALAALNDPEQRSGRAAVPISPQNQRTFAPFTVNTTVNLDGKKIAESTKTYTQRDLRSNPRQKRGAGAGLPRGD